MTFTTIIVTCNSRGIGPDLVSDFVFDSLESSLPQFMHSHTLDSFEYEAIPVARTGQVGTGGDLWRNNQVNQNNTTRPANLFTTTDVNLFGSRSLQLDRLADIANPDPASNRAFQVMLYNNFGDASNDWKYIKDRMPGWETGRIDRVRFWFKAPPEMSNHNTDGSVKDAGQSDSLHFATFLRSAATVTTSNESDNAHFYHYYNIKYEGNLWHQVLVDTHPNHQRGANGALEEGIITDSFAAVETGETYFDAMTYFYFDHKNTNSTYPATFYFDGVEFYEEPNDEDITNIYGLFGVYNDISGEIVLGWNRDKDAPNMTFDVKQADSSFFDAGGFASIGTAMPNGTAINNGRSLIPDGYNRVDYRGTIDVSGKNFIYLAIKASVEATRFREIRIPVTVNGYPSIREVE